MVRFLTVLFAFLGFFTSVAKACSLFWHLPSSHFPNVDSKGYVSVNREILKLPLSDTFSIPLYASFDSGFYRKETMLGTGWSLPFFESHLEWLDDQTLKVHQPNGFYRIYKRDKTQANVLSNSNGWSGEVQGEKVVLRSNEDTELVFEEGRLISVSSKEYSLLYHYSDGELQSVKAGDTWIMLDRSKLKEGTLLIRTPSSQVVQIYFHLPQEDLKDGPALREILVNNRSIFRTKQESNASNPVLKKLTVDQEMWLWNLDTGKVLADNQWSYEVVPGEGRSSNAAIKRTNLMQESEFWHYDRKRGILKRSSHGRPMEIQYSHTSGPAKGQVFRRETEQNGVVKVVEENEFNDQGVLVRKNGLPYREVRNASGEFMEIHHGDQLIFEKSYVDGKLRSFLFQGTRTFYIDNTHPLFPYFKALIEASFKKRGPRYEKYKATRFEVNKEVGSTKVFDWLFALDAADKPLPIFAYPEHYEDVEKSIHELVVY